MINNQLSIFTEIAISKINMLRDALNLDRKPKDFYSVVKVVAFHDMYLICAENKQSEQCFNLVDQLGEIPSGFCANFRDLKIIFDEINHYKKAENAII